MPGVWLDRMSSSAISWRGKRGRTMRKVAAKAVPGMILGGIIPALCFLVGRRAWGLAGGIVLVLLWSLAYQIARWVRTRSISGLVILYLLVLALRGSTALVFHSASMFYITPSLVTIIGGCVFIASGLMSKPLVSPILNELVPNSVLDCRDARVRSAMVKISLIYGVEQLVNAAVMILMVLKLSTTVYVTTHGAVSWFIMGLFILAGIPLVWKELRSAVQWDRSSEQSETAGDDPALLPAPVELQVPGVTSL